MTPVCETELLAALQGGLRYLGHEIGRGAIATVLKEAGIDHAAQRGKGATWKEFLRTGAPSS